jgi:glucose/arabinose dehydrogenase
MSMLYRRCLLSFAICALLAACGAEATPAESTAPTLPAAPRATDAPAANTAAPAAPTAPRATGASAANTATPNSPATALPASGTRSPVALKLVSDDLRSPVYVTHAGDGSGRLFVVEKGGTIALLRNGQRAPRPFLDITALVNSSGSEQGLLGLAFHPDYAHNGRFFVYYTARNGDNTLARYEVSNDPDVADAATGTVLFAQADPAPNHNGGMLAFGPDTYLYVGMGDGGSAGDPWGNGQKRSVLLGKLLRLDVDHGDPYAIPPDNPWASGGDARPEIWAYGLRNPWRFSFDRATGDLYIGDVGQGQYEEIDFQPAGEPGGRNYGWNIREGMHCFRSQNCDTNGLIDPISEYGHEFGCSITGGYVYRGAAIPQFQGTYVYGDYCSGLIWTLKQTVPGQWAQSDLLDSKLGISSFGEDEVGELYLTDLGGGLYQFVENR